MRGFSFALVRTMESIFFLLYFHYMPFSVKVKHCTESLQSLFSWQALYLFGELYGIMVLRSNSAHFIGKEVGTMNHIFAFMTSVAANVVSHFVCKWLDGWFKDRKH